MKLKTIKVTEGIHKVLTLYKDTFQCKSYSDTIQKMYNDTILLSECVSDLAGKKENDK